jgi:hypothetical protein
VVEWDGFNFKTNKFLNGLWGRNFGGDLGGVFWSGFWSGGKEWCAGREMMGIIFGLGAMALGIRKTNWERRAKGRSQRRGEVAWGERVWWRGGETVEGFELAKLYQL